MTSRRRPLTIRRSWRRLPARFRTRLCRIRDAVIGCARMSMNRQVWHWMCAAIVLIAVQFAPAIAAAHGAHDHGHAVHNHGLHTHTAKAPAAILLPGGMPYATHSAMRIGAAESTAAGDVPAASIQSGSDRSDSAPSGSDGCLTGCCGIGLGCCVAALTAAQPAPERVIVFRRVAFDGPVPASGTEPASLRKPPRLLA